MHNMQVLCSYYVKDHMNFISKIWAQWIDLFHTFLLLFRFKSKYGCQISSKITKLYFILNIIQLLRGLKII